MVRKLILFKGVNLWCLSKIGNLKVISFLGKKSITVCGDILLGIVPL